MRDVPYLTPTEHPRQSFLNLAKQHVVLMKLRKTESVILHSGDSRAEYQRMPKLHLTH